jgi:hypothetical protein
LDAALRIALKCVICVSNEEACLGQFEVDVHDLSVPNASAGRPGRKTLRRPAFSLT